MQNWSCGYYLLYFAPFVPLFVIHRMWTLGTLRTVRTWTLLIAAAAGTLVRNAALPVSVPRGATAVCASSGRSARSCPFSANFWSYLTASENLNLWGEALRFSPRPEGETFLGFMPWLLAAVALVSLIPRLQPRAIERVGDHRERVGGQNGPRL